MKGTQSGVKQQSMAEERGLGGEGDEPGPPRKRMIKLGHRLFKGRDKDEKNLRFVKMTDV